MHFEVRTLRLGLNWHISLLVCARHTKKKIKRDKIKRVFTCGNIN